MCTHKHPTLTCLAVLSGSERAVRTVEETAARAREALELQLRLSSTNISLEALMRQIENARATGDHHQDSLRYRSKELRSLLHQHSLSLQQAVLEHEAAVMRLHRESTERMLAEIHQLESAYLHTALELAAATFQQEAELVRQQSNTSVHVRAVWCRAQLRVIHSNADQGEG